MKNSVLTLPLVALGIGYCSLNAQSGSELQLKIASTHPIQYYISLPRGWSMSRSWPVVVVLEAAEKEYEKNAQRFVDARGKSPFIIVAPFNTNNGNNGRRDPALFPYSLETWDYMDKIGDCAFNDEGIIQIVNDVCKLYNGEKKIYITGFEAGAHALWSMVFNHPEYLKAAVPVAGNFRNRCINESSLKEKQIAATILIHSFVGDEDSYFRPQGNIYNQWLEAKDLTLKVGYKSIEETVIKGKAHVPLPNEVMNYFQSLVE